MIGIILGIALFMLLVMIHELGHFIVAKKSWVKVLEFGIGIPPKVCKLWTDKSGTEYTLNLLPLWGFVRLKGEDPSHEEDFKAKDSFITAKVWKKIIILLAGVAMNFIFARAIFTTVFTLGTRPLSLVPENLINSTTSSYLMPTKQFLYSQWYITENLKLAMEQSPVLISEIISGGMATNLGLLSGDTIKSINNYPVNAWNIEHILKDLGNKEITLFVSRAWRTQQFQWVCTGDACFLGVKFGYVGINPDILSSLSGDIIKFPLPQAMLAALHEINAEAHLTFSALGNLGKNLLSFNKWRISGSLDKLSGPVGAVKFGQTLLANGRRKLFLAFGGMISLALALFNVLPIPALDGGRLLGVLIQWIGRLKPEKYFTIENYINLVFFVVLMGLGVYLIFRDLIKFWGVKIPFIG